MNIEIEAIYLRRRDNFCLLLRDNSLRFDNCLECFRYIECNEKQKLKKRKQKLFIHLAHVLSNSKSCIERFGKNEIFKKHMIRMFSDNIKKEMKMFREDKKK